MAIQKAEEELKNGSLYCLGDIVHNGQECTRLRQLGLITLTHQQLPQLHDARMLLRAHGEPPHTYELAMRNHIDIVDATCPVVLTLQRRIKQDFEKHDGAQIVIYGKSGHAEVIGLVGQTQGQAIVVETMEDVEHLDFQRDIKLYAQTTQSPESFYDIVQYIKQHIVPGASFIYHNTLCHQVSNRLQHIRHFASTHDAVVFVCGGQSSNGQVLYETCRQVNSRSYRVDGPADIQRCWFQPSDLIGVCGATSTPKWLMEACRQHILIQLASPADVLPRP